MAARRTPTKAKPPELNVKNLKKLDTRPKREHSQATPEELSASPIRQRLFAELYVEYNHNGTKAARDCGFAIGSAPGAAAHMLKLQTVRDLIAAREKELLERYKISSDRVMAEVAKIGFSNMADFTVFTDETRKTRVIDFSKATHDEMAAVASLEIEQEMRGRGENAYPVMKTKIRLHPKLEALVTMMKHLGGQFERGKDGSVDGEDGNGTGTLIRVTGGLPK